MQKSAFFSEQRNKACRNEKGNQIIDFRRETLTHICTQGKGRRIISKQKYVTEHEHESSEKTTHLSEQTSNH